MKNKGLRTHRLNDNPLERLYQKDWDILNTGNGHGVLDYLLSDKINNPCGEVSKRDIVVAATVVQWLGSSVGQDFIGSVNRKFRDHELGIK